MSRLPPATKLPMTLRKNVRDEFEDKKPELEAALSKVLGNVAWTIDVDPLALFPYAEERFAKERLGSCITEYINGATTLIDRRDAHHKEELNKLATAHVLTIDVDESGKINYSGVDINDGKLRILFGPKNLGVNVSRALEDKNLDNALNNASSQAGAALSFIAMEGLRKYWEPKQGEILASIEKSLGKPIKVNPNLEANFAALKEESQKPGTQLIKHWENNFGNSIYGYMNAFDSHLKFQKFPGDEMLQEGFFDAVDKEEVVLRTVDKLVKGNWNEVVIEDGVLYIQTTPAKWANNVHDAGKDLVALL